MTEAAHPLDARTGEPWVELRVHGVSGTPPESMLDFDRVKQVAGDEFGRFFRGFREDGTELRGGDGHTVEAYHWGKYTSASWSQALWLLLAPFGLVNAAQFMLQPPTTGGKAKFCHAVAGAMLRLVALALTGLFVFGAAVVTMDLWAWQSVAPTRGYEDQLIAIVALLAPVAVLVGCYRLGSSQLVAMDHRDEDGKTPPEAPTMAGWPPPTGLVRPGFFGGDPDAPALGRLHLGAGLAVVALLGLWPGRDTGGGAVRVAFWLTVLLLILIAAVVVILGDPEKSATVKLNNWLDNLRRWWHGVGPRRGSKSPVSRAASSCAVLAAVSILAALTYRGFNPPVGMDVGMPYPGVDRAGYVILLVAAVALLVLVLSNLGLVLLERNASARRDVKRFAPYARGFACTLVTAQGFFLGVGFVGAFAVVAAKALGTSPESTAGPSRVGGVEAPELLSRIVYSWGLSSVATIFLVIYCGGCWKRSRHRLKERVQVAFTRSDGVRMPSRWVSHTATAIWAARLKNSVVAIIATYVVIGTVSTVYTVIELWPTGQTTDELTGILSVLSPSVAEGNGRTEVFLWIGTLTLTGLALGLVTLGRTALLGESTRRGVNVLWDVIAFWPRSAHPFVPPAYSQRAVPDIEKRITWHLDPVRHRHLVLCGHSQGSLLSFAALLRRAQHHSLADIGLVTFGSQLQIMFSRAFPAYVNYATIDWLFVKLDGRWRNLYRDTDPLAGPVLSWHHYESTEPEWVGKRGTQAGMGLSDDPADGRREYGPDWRLLDPPIPDLELQTHAISALFRHSNYWSDPAWPDALAAVRGSPPMASSGT